MINSRDEIMLKFAIDLGKIEVPPPAPPKFEDISPEYADQVMSEIEEDKTLPIPIPLPKEEPFGPEYVADTDPRAYIKTYRYHKNPKLDHITERMMVKMVDETPEQFFDIGLNSTKYWDLKQWKPWAARGVIEKDPIVALETYKLHRDRSLRELSKDFWESLKDKVDKKRLLKEKRFLNEVRYLARVIALTYPEYYLEEIEEDPLFSGYSNFARRTLKEEQLQGE